MLCGGVYGRDEAAILLEQTRMRSTEFCLSKRCSNARRFA